MKASVCIDWLSFSVLHTFDPDIIIRDYLRLKPDIFTERGFGINGYRSCKYYDDIRIYYNGREGTADSLGRGAEFMGVYVSLSGNACRQYANLGGDIMSLIGRCHKDDEANITRIDLACDEKEGLLDFPTMIRYYDNKQIRSRCRKRRLVRSADGDVAPAFSLYIGSPKSDLFYRIYDKAKEQYDPYKDADNYNSHWVRVEMVLRHQNAKNAVGHLLAELESGRELGQIVSEIINGHLSFVEKNDANISRCSLAKWWADFLETVGAVKVTSSEKTDHVFTRKFVWFYDNIAPLASALMEGVGTMAFLSMLEVSQERRKNEYENMLVAYKRDPMPGGLVGMLGFEFGSSFIRQQRRKFMRRGGRYVYDKLVFERSQKQPYMRLARQMFGNE